MNSSSDSLLKFDISVLVKSSKSQKVSNSRDGRSDFLTIICCREWSKGNKVWVQKVSSAPSTRADLLQLQEQLDMKLEQEQARHAGICPIRRELYSQCFDELIRQESVLCEERGLLLLRLRDEIRMSMAAHQKLYENTLSHGIRHVMRKEDLQERIRVLENEKQELLKEINEQKENSDANKKRQTEMRETAEKKYDEEKQTNQKSKYFCVYTNEFRLLFCFQHFEPINVQNSSSTSIKKKL
uniref:Axonemal dynein light intermediate polypeptide 1 n=1 Tax=Cyprinodon variegatus TaxID=28743 RepID=A0A3Q2FZN7_CYPVA